MNLARRLLGIANARSRALLSPLIRVIEDRIWPGDEANPVSPVFIVGAPRTGSTILYQALTNAYAIAYIDNLACRWHRNLRFGIWRSRRKFGDTPHDNFSADHGDTLKFGDHAPSECGQFWYRWLPRDRHFIDFGECDRQVIDEIGTELFGVIGQSPNPLLIKNLNAGQRLRLIREIFPDARFIFIRRDPRFVVHSILRARRAIGIEPGHWWSIMPSNVKELLDLPESSMCAAQVYFLEKQIEEDLTLFPEENVREVHYRKLSTALIADLGRWMGAERRPGARLPEFHRDSMDALSSPLRRELDQLAGEYPFRSELFA